MNSIVRPVLVLTLLLAFAGSLRAQQDPSVIDGVAAVVGKNIIKYSDIENAFIQVRLKQGLDNAQENRCKIMENYLLSKLLIHKGEVDSIEVSDENVASQVDYYLKAYLQQYGSKEAMRQATGYSYDEMHDLYTDLIHDRMLTQRAQSMITGNVKITPMDVEAYYKSIPQDSLLKNKIPEEIEVSEIVLEPKISEEERERVKTQIAQLRERIVNGERFSMLATLYSEDPGSAKKGGELGFFMRGAMVPEFEAAAFALKPGEVSPIVESAYGYHIIQLIERRGNSINCRHILLIPKVSPQDQLAARMKLDSIATQVRLGQMDFAEAARTYSVAPTKSSGGVVANPMTGNNRLTKEVFKELYPGISTTSMNAGDVSNATLIKDDQENKTYYKIVQLNKRYPEHVANLQDDYDKLYDLTLEQAKEKKLWDWAAKMARNTYIRIADEFKDCNYRIQWTQD